MVACICSNLVNLHYGCMDKCICSKFVYRNTIFRFALRTSTYIRSNENQIFPKHYKTFMYTLNYVSNVFV